MRIAVLTGLLACTQIFAQATTIASAAPEIKILNNKEQSVVSILSIESDTALSVITKQAVEEEEKVVEPQVQKHVVEDNESLITIAKQHGVSWNRLFDKNTNIENPDVISVGTELVIPMSDEEIPQREIPKAVPVVQTKSVSKKNTSVYTAKVQTSRGSSSGNGYVAGYCTWYVKSRRPDLPNNLGNASMWVSRATSQGIPTGSAPRAGAVAQRNNHVAYVESVNGDGTITVSDMNYRNLYEKTVRVVPANQWRYIY